MCVSLSSDSSETIEVTIIKFDKITVSDANASHVNYIDLDLQSRSDFHHENKCLIISEIVQAIPIKFAVKIVRLKVYSITSI